jgi:hypothetical protein
MSLQILRPDLPDKEMLSFLMATTINEHTKGRANNFGEVTLTASATSTTVADVRVKSSMVIFLSPRSATAAVATGNAYISAVTDGSFTITHANTADADKNFWYHFHG